MTLQFNPHPPQVDAMSAQLAAGAKSLSVLMMAPVALTPLLPPSSGPAGAPAKPGQGSSDGRRQAFFTGKQQALLNRLQQSSEPAQGSALSASQRHTCAAVASTVAAAAASVASVGRE